MRGVETRQVAARSDRLLQWATSCVAVHGGEMMSGSTTGPCQYARCPGVRSNDALLLPGLPHDKLLLVVSGLAVRC
jgi:hypothetical protein